MENYEKKYNNALERARGFYNNEECRVGMTPIDLEVIFPELAESEDDLTWLTKYIEEEAYSLSLDIRDDEDSIRLKKLQKAVAWLKKQSEQKPTLPKWKYKNDDAPLSRDSLILNRYGCVVKAVSGAMVSGVWVLDYDELAKLPKEEKADSTNIPVLNFKAKDWYVSKVDGKIHKIHTFDEPRFKVGDWVVNSNSGGVSQVTEIRDDEYCLWPLDANIVGYLKITDVDNNYRLWTIKDAKDGDILMANAPFIFNGNLEGGIGCPGAHCAINTLGKFQIPKYQTHWTGHTTTPATKDQCDTLFAKMREAGYEWNAEKKELKKIPNALEECEIVHVEHGKYYYCIKDYYAGGNKRASKGDVVQALNGMSMMTLGVKANEYFIPVKKIKQKLIWKADDEKNLNAVLSFIGDEYLRRWLKDIIHKEYDE